MYRGVRSPFQVFGRAVDALLSLAFHFAKSSAASVRARDLGEPFDGTPGPLNAITDLAGVQMGATTLIRGEGLLRVGEGPVRTGVTSVFPHDIFLAFSTANPRADTEPRLMLRKPSRMRVLAHFIQRPSKPRKTRS